MVGVEQSNCPSVNAVDLPHHVPSTTNNFGSRYDVTYIAPNADEKHVFTRPKTSGYLHNRGAPLSNTAIDYSRAQHGVGRGPGQIPPLLLSQTAQARSSHGLHSFNDVGPGTGTTEMRSTFAPPQPLTHRWKPFKYAGAHQGEGVFDAIHGNPPALVAEKKKQPIPPPCRPATARVHGGNAFSPHQSKGPLATQTTNSTYGDGAPDTERKRASLPTGPLHGENIRDRLYSNSVQKCPVPSSGIRQYPEDQHNPIRLSTMAAERCRIGRKLENEGWVKWNTVAQTSFTKQQNLPETEGLNRSRALNAPARCAARGGNSNKEMFGDVQARVVIDETQIAPNATVDRLQKSLEAKFYTQDRHEHRANFSAYSARFRR